MRLTTQNHRLQVRTILDRLLAASPAGVCMFVCMFMCVWCLLLFLVHLCTTGPSHAPAEGLCRRLATQLLLHTLWHVKVTPRCMHLRCHACFHRSFSSHIPSRRSSLVAGPLWTAISAPTTSRPGYLARDLPALTRPAAPVHGREHADSGCDGSLCCRR